MVHKVLWVSQKLSFLVLRVNRHRVLIWERVRPTDRLEAIDEVWLEIIKFLGFLVNNLEVVLQLHRHVAHLLGFRGHSGCHVNRSQNVLDTIIYALFDQVLIHITRAVFLPPLEKCHTMLL